MKYLIAILAAGALMLATASDAHAQKGYGGYGSYGAYGYGGGAGHHGYGHGGHGHHGYGHGGHWGNWNHHRYYGSYHNLHNVPALPPPAYNAGPPSPTVTYPYYTVRGPRDFLLNNPPSLGP